MRSLCSASGTSCIPWQNYAVAIEYPVLNNKDNKDNEDFKTVVLSAFLLYLDKQLW